MSGLGVYRDFGLDAIFKRQVSASTEPSMVCPASLTAAQQAGK
jgi:hypothetical protein